MKEELPIWAVRVDGIRDAQRRSRSVFAIITVISVAMLISSWNSYYSWYGLFARDLIASETSPPPTLPLNETTPSQKEPTTSQKEPTLTTQDEIKRKLILDWVSSRRVTVPLLGVSIGNSDGPLLGTFSLLVLSIWFYKTIRKENNLIGNLVRDANQYTGTDETQIKQFVYHGIVSQLVFILLDDEEKQIMSLEKTDPPQFLRDGILKNLTYALFWLPFLTGAALLVADMDSLFHPSLFRPGSIEPLYTMLGSDDWRHIVFVYFLSIIFLLLIFILNSNLLRCKDGTRTVIQDYRQILRDKPVPPLQTP